MADPQSTNSPPATPQPATPQTPATPATPQPTAGPPRNIPIWPLFLILALSLAAWDLWPVYQLKIRRAEVRSICTIGKPWHVARAELIAAGLPPMYNTPQGMDMVSHLVQLD